MDIDDNKKDMLRRPLLSDWIFEQEYELWQLSREYDYEEKCLEAEAQGFDYQDFLDYFDQ